MAFADSPERPCSLPRISTQSFKDVMKEREKDGVMNTQTDESTSGEYFLAILCGFSPSSPIRTTRQ